MHKPDVEAIEGVQQEGGHAHLVENRLFGLAWPSCCVHLLLGNFLENVTLPEAFQAVCFLPLASASPE